MEYNDEDARIIKDALLKLYIAYDQQRGFIEAYAKEKIGYFMVATHSDGYSENERAIKIFGETKLRNGKTIDSQFITTVGSDIRVWHFPLSLNDVR